MLKALKCLSLAAAGLLVSLNLASAQTYTLKIGSGTVNDTSQEWLRLFKQGVEKRSNGKIKVETYVASALGPNPRLVEGVALGTIEAGVPNTGFWVSLEPRFVVFDAVGMFDTPGHAVKVLQDPEIHKMVSSYGTEKGVETISVFWHSPLAVITKKPIWTVNDFAGLKLRTPGGAPLAVKPVEKLKASPISMPINDALPALQNGTIDGIITGSTVAATLKYYDVAKYMTMLPKTMIFVSAVVNGGFMKKIGTELATIVREEALKAEDPAVKWGEADAKNAEKTWKEHGGEIIEMAPKDAEQYLADVTGVDNSILSQNPKVYADYKKILAAAKKDK